MEKENLEEMRKVISANLGIEMTDEIVEFATLASAQWEKQIREDIRRGTLTFFGKGSQINPFISFAADQLAELVKIIITGSSIMGAFYYRRWMIQGGVDVKNIEDQSKLKGTLKEDFYG